MGSVEAIVGALDKLKTDEVAAHHLPPEILDRRVEEAEPPPAQEEPKNLGSLERMFLVETMRRFHGNAVEAAKAFTLGDPMSEATRLGPLSSQMQLERVRSYIRKGVDEGAELLKLADA